MKKNFLAWTVHIAFLFYILIAPISPVPMQVQTNDKNIAIVDNPLTTETTDKTSMERKKISLEKILYIDTQHIDNVTISFIISIEADSHGAIYILDKKLNTVVKLDSSGGFVKTIGRSGQGPGEFISPRNLSINNQDQLTVFDRRNRKFLFFKNDGTLVKELILHFDAVEGFCLNNGNFLFRENVLDRETGKFENILSIYNKDLKKIKEIGRIELPNRFSKKIKGIQYNLPWTVYKNRIISGTPGKDYQLKIFNLDGELEKIIKKEYRKIPPSQTYKEKYIEPVKRNPRVYNLIKDKLYFPDYLPPYHYLMVDESGRIYVQTYETEADTGNYIFDIFDLEGKLISRFPIKDFGLPDTLLGKFLNDRLYCVHTDEMGEPHIAVYKVKWN